MGINIVICYLFKNFLIIVEVNCYSLNTSDKSFKITEKLRGSFWNIAREAFLQRPKTTCIMIFF